MQLRKRWLGRVVFTGVVLAGGVALAGCAETTSSEATGDAPATVEEVEEGEVPRVTVTKKAAERLGIEMVPIRAGASSEARLVPYAAVVYDPTGETWVYTSPKPFTYVRAAVTVGDVDGERAVITQGPETGTEVVTVGTAELYGTEQEIGG